jgi:predicted nucleic acid-binding protein
LVSAESSPFEESDLDRGETTALAVAVEQDLILLTDDLAARETAEKAEVQARGSLGVIALACGRGRLEKDEAADRMRALQRETSLFVTDAVVERGIELLETDE